MKLDILAFGAHPDDVELGAGGILASHAANGLTTGIVDLTLGEMGTRGTPEIRLKEAKNAAGELVQRRRARDHGAPRAGRVTRASPVHEPRRHLALSMVVGSLVVQRILGNVWSV